MGNKQNSNTGADQGAGQGNEELDKVRAEMADVNNALTELQGKLDAETQRANDAEAKADTATKQAEAAQQEASQQKERADKAEAALVDAGEKPNAKEARGEEIKDYLKPDYDGPINVQQARERVEHFKRLKKEGKKVK
ncbi:MAG: hypothetical protein HUJ30_02375 [Gammaproteobacteria bacterium]|nr:hypothetical protein [Gammaproteobacteria bacterium]